MSEWFGRVTVPALIALVAIAVSACAAIAPENAAPAQMAAAATAETIDGSVVFEADAPLPEDAVLRVEVIDTTRGEYPANVVAAHEGGVGQQRSPLAFQLPVDPNLVDSGAKYVIGARIMSGGATLFMAQKDIPLRTGNASGNVEIPVGPLSAQTDSAGEPAQSAGVVGGRVTWEGGASLPNGAVLVVEIVETTNSGFDAEPFASTQLGVSGATSPIPFELQVTQPATQTEYLIRAQVYEGETMTWMSEGAQRWGTGDAPFTDVDLVIVPIEGATARAKVESPFTGVLTGTLAYLQNLELPAGAVAEVALVDLGVGSIIAAQRGTTTGVQPPLPFSLKYDPAAIAPEGQYGLLAQISIDGVSTFATLDPVPVLTGGAPATGIDLILDVTTAAMTQGEGETLVEGSVTGQVTYRQRIALPAGAVVKVSLQDVSQADASAVVLSTQVITTTGEQVPIAFNLPYDPAQIDDRFTYTVSARIEIDGKLAWINDTSTPVITQGNPTSDVTIVVVQVQ